MNCALEQPISLPWL